MTLPYEPRLVPRWLSGLAGFPACVLEWYSITAGHLNVPDTSLPASWWKIYDGWGWYLNAASVATRAQLIDDLDNTSWMSRMSARSPS